MQSEHRQKQIENYLKEVEFASLDELSEKLDVSLSTIRRDLTYIEGKGQIRRTHGGARMLDHRRDEYIFSARQQVESESKDRIGAACAELVSPGENLFIDGGSTVFAVARHLEAKMPHIVTNSLSVANLFASHNEIEVVVSGGIIYPKLQVLVGGLATEAFKSLNANIAIMGGGGATEDGIMNSHMLLIETQHAMIASAQKVVFCLDHTKIGRRSIISLCGWDSVDILITNKEASGELLKEIEKQGVEVLLA
jgi:DeoR family fructose operon transcriptional repressor